MPQKSSTLVSLDHRIFFHFVSESKSAAGQHQHRCHMSCFVQWRGLCCSTIKLRMWKQSLGRCRVQPRSPVGVCHLCSFHTHTFWGQLGLDILCHSYICIWWIHCSWTIFSALEMLLSSSLDGYFFFGFVWWKVPFFLCLHDMVSCNKNYFASVLKPPGCTRDDIGGWLS